MLKINFSNQAMKFLKKIDQKHGKQVAQKIMGLRINPFPNDSQKLIGYDYFRADIGEYRIIYLVKENTLFIYVIGKRNDEEVYKILRRK